MNVVVFGGTGGTGRLIIEGALAGGHRVRAFVRNPATLSIVNANLEITAGNLLDEAALATAIQGQDAVISALGTGSSRASTTVYSDSATRMVAAMKRVNVDRFIGITSGGVVDDPGEPFWYRCFVKPFLHNIYADMKLMEKIISDSHCRWTFIRPSYLTNGPSTGMYRTAIDRGTIRGGWRISRGDVANFVIRNLSSDEFIYHYVAIAY